MRKKTQQAIAEFKASADANQVVYYASALNASQQIELMRVTRRLEAGNANGGRDMKEEWLGVTFRDDREADKAMREINCRRW